LSGVFCLLRQAFVIVNMFHLSLTTEALANESGRRTLTPSHVHVSTSFPRLLGSAQAQSVKPRVVNTKHLAKRVDVSTFEPCIWLAKRWSRCCTYFFAHAPALEASGLILLAAWASIAVGHARTRQTDP
jgi:hypothetical protein